MYDQRDLATDVFVDFDELFTSDIERIRTRQPRTMRPMSEKLPEYREVIQMGYRATEKKKYKAFYFVSHRWDSVEDPDPTSWQFNTLRQIYFELRCNNLLPACFWYDYCCMPQGSRTAEEQAFFEVGLDRLNLLSKECDTIALISSTSNNELDDFKTQLNRGWILCELLIALDGGKWRWTFHETDGDIFAAATRRTLDVAPAVRKLLQKLPRHSTEALQKWCDENGVSCTNGNDLPYLVERMVHWCFSINRNPTLPDLERNVTHILTVEEIAEYFIDGNGRSPAFPDCIVLSTPRVADGAYEVIVTDPDLSHMPLGEEQVLTGEQLRPFCIDARGKSIHFPHLVFECFPLAQDRYSVTVRRV